MRLIIIVGLIGFAIWWAIGKIGDVASIDKAKERTAAIVEKATPAEKKPQAPGDGFARSASKVFASKKPDVPRVSRSVKFQFRDFPPSEFFASLSAFDVAAIPDPFTRSVMLRGESAAVDQVADLLMESDQLTQTCSARAWVLWLSESDAKAFDLVATLGMLTPGKLTASIDGAGLILSAPVGDVAAALDIIRNNAAVHLLQEPHLRLVHGSTATIESVEQVPVRQTTVSNGTATESIDYKRAGLEMSITPQFLARDMVRLDVVQVGGLVGRFVEIAGAQVPVLQTQKVATSCQLTIGQSVVLGGVRLTRTRKESGFLKSTTQLETGVLYVVLSIYDETPQARPVTVPGWIEPPHMLPPRNDLPLPLAVPPALLGGAEPDL
jgi:type II secretory pathway component GspD/PulD (secretin)